MNGEWWCNRNQPLAVSTVDSLMTRGGIKGECMSNSGITGVPLNNTPPRRRLEFNNRTTARRRRIQ